MAPSAARLGAISLRLLAWFSANAREMEWRETRDPYRVWISEIMLQQTRVETVAPYYRRFLGAFPAVEALAGASPDAVMKAWEGLGYYARARNLHRAAVEVVREFGGRVPSTVEELSSLPGVGRSTAGAIAALAFGRDAPILDANAKRVIARLLSVQEDLSRPEAVRLLWDASAGLILPGRGRETALALMDLGAMVCLPRAPKCAICPLASLCEGRRDGVEERIPARRRRREIPHRSAAAAVILDGRGRVFIARRPPEGLLGGMWEFPGGEPAQGESPERFLVREIRIRWGMTIAAPERLPPVRHAYSHFRVTLVPVRFLRRAGAAPKGGEWRWISPEELEKVPFPGAARKLIARAFPEIRSAATPATARPAPSRSPSHVPVRTRRGGRTPS
ncbi:MAG: A/G-specific adenine glycosylase [Deltaproteobacteria bacterium GWC2_65_14]|nr:MAG: A/G-specific adenine glycosylase [Deltaproteobacteria bacterium GWC2_65_14]